MAEYSGDRTIYPQGPSCRRRTRTTQLSVASFVASLCLSTRAIAVEYVVDVFDMDDRPMQGAVVFLEPKDPATPSPTPPLPGVMDQQNRQFQPHILVVQRGAEVSFPNSDSIKHHVFSFSPAKTFEIRLYRGETTEPLVFEKTGAVELGCNVHDWMLGYIYVVDSPYFTRSDAQGRAVIEAPASDYTLGIWHPRIDAPESLVQRPTTSSSTNLRVTLDRPLLPDYAPSDAVDFDDYN